MAWWILSYDSKGLGQFSGLVAALRIRRTVAQIRYDNERKCSTRSKKLGLVSRCGLAAVYTEKPTTRSGHVARDNQACPATLLLVACLTWHILSSQRRTRPPIVCRLVWEQTKVNAGQKKSERLRSMVGTMAPALQISRYAKYSTKPGWPCHQIKLEGIRGDNSGVSISPLPDIARSRLRPQTTD